MNRIALALTAFVGSGLLLAAGTVLLQESHPPLELTSSELPAVGSPQMLAEREEDLALQVNDPLLVVNRDGSATIGANLQSVKDFEVSLMGVVVWAGLHRVPVNATQWWLPVPANERAQVGAASDAGGFVIPAGIKDGTRVAIEFWFDDGTCVPADVIAIARTSTHRSIYPKTGRSIGPVTSDHPPAGSPSCSPKSRPTAVAGQSS